MYLHRQHCCRTNRSYVNKFTLQNPIFTNQQCNTTGKSDHFMLTVTKDCKTECLHSSIGHLHNLISEVIFEADKDEIPNVNLTLTLFSLHREFDLFDIKLLKNLIEVFTILMSNSKYFNIRLVIFNFAGFDNQTNIENPESVATIGRVLKVLSPAAELVSMGNFDAVALNNPQSLQKFIAKPSTYRYTRGVLELAEVLTNKLAVKIIRKNVDNQAFSSLSSQELAYQI